MIRHIYMAEEQGADASGEGGAVETAVDAGTSEGAAGPTGAVDSGTTWTDGLSEDHSGFLSNKAFDSPDKLITAYQQLEAMRGVPEDRLLKLPAADAESSEWDAVYARLGRPESAEDYDFGSPEVGEGQVDMTPWFRGVAFDAGVSQEKAAGMIASFSEFQQSQANAHNEAMNTRDQTEMAQLRSEWGQTFDEREHVVTSFVRAMGWDDGVIYALQDLKGEKWLYENFYKLGKGVPEAQFASAEGSRGGVGRMSPGEARDKLRMLKSDKEYMQKWNSGDQSKVEEMRRFEEIADPEFAKGDTFDPVRG